MGFLGYIKSFFEILEKHFNDVLGVMLPGALLILGAYFTGLANLLGVLPPDFTQPTQVIILLLATILGGHFADQFGKALPKILEAISPKTINKNIKTWLNIPGKQTTNLSESDAPLEQEKSLYEEDLDFATKFFVEWMETHGLAELGKDIDPHAGLVPIKARELRSIAMTLSKEGEFLSRKFKFIELLCRASAASLIITALLAFCHLMIQLIGGQPMSLKFIALIVLSFVIAPILLERSKKFRSQSDRVPFSYVVANILRDQVPADAAIAAASAAQKRRRLNDKAIH